MTLTIPWVYCEAALAIGACVGAGALLGILVALVRGGE